MVDRRARASCRTARPSSPRSRVAMIRPDIYLSPRGGFGLYLRRHGIFPLHHERLTLKETETDHCRAAGSAASVYGLVEIVPRRRQISRCRATSCRQRNSLACGRRHRAFHDPIRVPQAPPDGGRTNPFFADLYRLIVDGGQGIEAREHTAQVSPEERQERETSSGRQASACCSARRRWSWASTSPRLNVVSMRNVPPTPANYAQRSGRAGRRAAGAGVHFCSTGSAMTSTSSAAPSGWSPEGRAAPTRSRQRGPRPRPRARDLAERRPGRPGEFADRDPRGRGRRAHPRPPRHHPDSADPERARRASGPEDAAAASSGRSCQRARAGIDWWAPRAGPTA